MYTLNRLFMGTLMLPPTSFAPLQYAVNSLTVLIVTLILTFGLRRIPLVRRLVP